MKAACIIVNTTLKKLDRIFHYSIPKGMKLQIGHRVLVPFGAGNRKMEGYCIGFEKLSEEIKLKSVSKILDEQPLLSQARIVLAQFMKRRYICSMMEALHLLLPPAVHFQIEERVSLSDLGEPQLQTLSKKQRDVVEYLSQKKEPVALTLVKEAVHLGNRSVIDTLAKKGILRISEHTAEQQKGRFRKVVTLQIEAAEAEEAAVVMKKKAPAAAAALMVLAEQQSLSLSNLLQETSCSRQSVQVLERHGYVSVTDEEQYRAPKHLAQVKSEKQHTPTVQQRQAIEQITTSLQSGFEEFLLFGVTGSGKTEVFLQSVADCLSQGKQVIVLVPEIALTPQMTNRFLSRFQNKVAVLHSGLSLGERYDEWRRIHRGEAPVVIGARSAVFAPCDNIGLIIMDEEQETSYKSETNPRYHAREIAKYRAMQSGATVVYASATPSIESFYKAKQGEYTLLTLDHRYNAQALPEVQIVDLAKELQEGNHSVISRTLKWELQRNLAAGHQSILLMNRRGYSTFVSCRNCGYSVKCPHCSITLTYHIKENQLVCHYCGYTQNNVLVCPQCGSQHIKYFGTGTQKVEQQLTMLFPNARICRMDGDTTSRKLAHEKILHSFERKEIDILLGTQMVAKGLDFPNVTLVGVIAADTMLNMNDFRASERAFSLLAQVCGRAGRGKLAGRAVIQTYMPTDKTLLFAKSHDYLGFYQNEIRLRRFLLYPPFTQMVYITVSGEEQEPTERYIADLYQRLCAELKDVKEKTEILGPGPAGIPKVKNRFRYGMLIKTKQVKSILSKLEKMYYYHISLQNTFILGIDSNPNHIF